MQVWIAGARGKVKRKALGWFSICSMLLLILIMQHIFKESRGTKSDMLS